MHTYDKCTVRTVSLFWRRCFYSVEYISLAFAFLVVCLSSESLKLFIRIGFKLESVPLLRNSIRKLWGLVFLPLRRSTIWLLTYFRMQHRGYFSPHFSDHHSATTNSTAIAGNLSHAEQVLDRVKRGIRLKMDKVIDAYLTGGESDFPTCESPVWIFGRSYSVNYGKLLKHRALKQAFQT